MGPKGPFALGKIEQFGEYGFNLKSNSKKTSLMWSVFGYNTDFHISFQVQK